MPEDTGDVTRSVTTTMVRPGRGGDLTAKRVEFNIWTSGRSPPTTDPPCPVSEVRDGRHAPAGPGGEDGVSCRGAVAGPEGVRHGIVRMRGDRALEPVEVADDGRRLVAT